MTFVHLQNNGGTLPRIIFLMVVFCLATVFIPGNTQVDSQETDATEPSRILPLISMEKTDRGNDSPRSGEDGRDHPLPEMERKCIIFFVYLFFLYFFALYRQSMDKMG